MKRLVSFLVACAMIFCCMSAALGEPESNLWNGDMLFTLGTVNGDAYESKVMGYGCVLEGWTYSDADDLAAINNWGQHIMSEDMQAILAETDSFTDMAASSPDGLCNIVVQFQNMGRIYGALLTEELLIDITLPQFAPLLEQMGYEDLTVEKVTVMMGSDEHTGILVTGTMYGLPIYQKQACILCGEYMAVITVTSFFEDTTDDIFANFYAL